MEKFKPVSPAPFPTNDAAVTFPENEAVVPTNDAAVTFPENEAVVPTMDAAVIVPDAVRLDKPDKDDAVELNGITVDPIVTEPVADAVIPVSPAPFPTNDAAVTKPVYDAVVPLVALVAVSVVNFPVPGVVAPILKLFIAPAKTEVIVKLLPDDKVIFPDVPLALPFVVEIRMFPPIGPLLPVPLVPV